VLTSAAASTQTTILPTARTALSMGSYGALPKSFADVHTRYMIPTVATLTMGAISVVMYAAMNYLAGGYIIADSVTAIGIWIAFYYGLSGFACAWYYRKNLTSSARNLWMQGILPALGGLILYFAMLWSIKDDWNYGSDQSWTVWNMPFAPHWEIGGVFLIFFATAILGLVLMVMQRFASPRFFSGELLNRTTPAGAAEEIVDAPNSR
jgi:amino acid transporter